MDMETLKDIGWPALAVLAAGLYLFLLGCNVPLPPKKLRKKVWVFFLAMPLLLFGSSSVMLSTRSPSASEFVLQAVRRQVELPAELNEFVRLEDITAEENTIVYHMSIGAEGADTKRLAESMKKDLFQDACTNEDFLLGLQMGLNLEIRFKSLATSGSDSIVIKPADCKL